MATAIHIELDILFLIPLCVIAHQISNSVSQQTSRVLFRYVVYGVMAILVFDVAWMAIDGRMFPGAIALNKIINALYLGLGVTMGSLWYMYVLETLGYKIAHSKLRLVMVPPTIFSILNFLSIKTGWIFTITDENVYVRGPWFPAQTVMVLATMLVSLFHILYFLIKPNERVPREVIIKLLNFYIVPFIGTLIALPFTGMPGTWTCAAVSIILMYMSDQEGAIVRDSLTGLNNRKTLQTTFTTYTKQTTEVRNLYLFMMDLNNFKSINDKLGHPTGDQALVEASHLLTSAVSDIQGIVARYGGDEFIVMGFFYGEPSAIEFKNHVNSSFEKWNEENQAPYLLSTSIGFSCYQDGQSLEELIDLADQNLYEEKRSRKQPA